MNDGPNNALELALEQAAMEPAARPEFYRLLLESEVFVLGHTETEGDGPQTLAPGENVSIVSWRKDDGTPGIPFFTSLEALQRAVTDQQPYVSMSARSLFVMAKGSIFVLNPGSSSGKEFLPHEIESMLATGTNQVGQSRVVQKPTEVMLGQPTNYPDAMISALTTLLAKHPSVKAAYLCLMHDPSTQEKPSLVVGFEGESLDRAMQDAGSVVADTATGDFPVDFVKVVRGDEGLSAYFIESVKPFYERTLSTKERTLGSKLKSIFSTGRERNK